MYNDFSGKDLRGRSFKNREDINLIGANFTKAKLTGADFSGVQLTDADFSDADIRSAKFDNAILIGADFCRAKAGLRIRQVIILLIVSFLLSFLSGLLSAIAGAWSGYLLSSITSNQVAGLIIIISSIFFIAILLHEGLQAIPKALGISGAVVGILTIVGALTGNASLPVSVMAGWSGVVIGTVAGTVTVALTLAVVASTAIFVAWAGTVAGGMFLGFSVSIAMVASVIGAVTVEILAGVGSLSMTLSVGILSAYMGRQTLAGKEKHAFLREMAIAFATIGGTSFREANLTDTDFTLATLKSTDFRRANLNRTCWHQTKKLDRVRPGTSYLANARVCQVLVTGRGQERNFDRANLRGINFRGANLQNASFINADLSNANLQDANLECAKLVQTQLDGTDLTGATLTGAYIQDWGITSTTKLDDVRCEYIYMRLPTKDNPEHHRKPHNNREVFKDGDFGDFIKPIFATLDLYHDQGVDPRAIAISINQLAATYPSAELEIVAIEKRGEDKLLLRVKTAADADKSQLSAEYYLRYSQLKSLAEQELQPLIAAKNSSIRDLKDALKTVMEASRVQIGNVYGDIGAVAGGGISGVAGKNLTGVAGRDISGSATTTSLNRSQAQIPCTSCDTKNPATSKFCFECGQQLIWIS